MKKNIEIKIKDYVVDVVTNGADEFDNVVICFHGFNGDRWGGAYTNLRYRLKKSLVVSFDSCGHGESKVKSEDMRLSTILEEIDCVVRFFIQSCKGKRVYFVANSYGAYRIMWYLINFKINVEGIILVNPAFRMLNILEDIRNFKYSNLGNDDKILMKSGTNKYLNKGFFDDLHSNNLYEKKYDIPNNIKLVVGSRDSLIPIKDTLEIAEKYNFEITYVDDEHSFENKDNWNVVVNMIE